MMMAVPMTVPVSRVVGVSTVVMGVIVRHALHMARGRPAIQFQFDESTA